MILGEKTVNRLLTALLLLILASAASAPVMAAGSQVSLITAAGQAEMLKDPGVDLAGAAHPDLTVVEFADYRCPYCKKFAPVLEAWLREDGRAAAVYKEWPILGDVSVYAARSALAARWQGKYLAAHEALMKAQSLETNQDVDRSLRAAGIDMRGLGKALDAHGPEIDALLARNEQEARALSIRGTPGIVVGRLLLPGIVDANDLKKLAATAREQR